MFKIPIILLAAIWGLGSAWFLVNGFRSGIMRCSLGMGRIGEVSREFRPAWFWIYAAVNLAIASICGFLVSALVFPGAD